MKPIRCMFGKHTLACVRTIVLDINGGADIEHAHQCIKCSFHRQFETEPMEGEMLSLLRGSIGEWGPVKDFEAPKTYIH